MSGKAILFNSEKLFGGGGHTVVPMSWRRETFDKGFAGLNGVLSIDLGLRGRKIKQRGRLIANSIAAIAVLAESISNYIDGQAYTLVDQNCINYANVRMDSFEMLEPVATGNQACCEYEIVYTQLSV